TYRKYACVRFHRLKNILARENLAALSFRQTRSTLVMNVTFILSFRLSAVKWRNLYSIKKVIANNTVGLRPKADQTQNLGVARFWSDYKRIETSRLRSR
ncbi:MAG: hypothetical protein K2O08_06510, partial [Clostridia bacterium]|nr:hypothetical protein [Clostridia bacterium]